MLIKVDTPTWSIFDPIEDKQNTNTNPSLQAERPSWSILESEQDNPTIPLIKGSAMSRESSVAILASTISYDEEGFPLMDECFKTPKKTCYIFPNTQQT